MRQDSSQLRARGSGRGARCRALADYESFYSNADESGTAVEHCSNRLDKYWSDRELMTVSADSYETGVSDSMPHDIKTRTDASNRRRGID